MSSPEQVTAARRVAAYINSLEVPVLDSGPGQWEVALESAGYPLRVTVGIRGPLLRAWAAVLPAGMIDPHQLLFWNRQAPFVAFAEDAERDVLVVGELPLEQLGSETLDRFLGLLLASATRAREFAIARS
ncbi:MAG TPA: YbjN domain-containing protein [Solirubrobacteraceae bacterium]|nr:YbjN domain-containing protein [Solirubrobacteraceae bacterium]